MFVVQRETLRWCVVVTRDCIFQYSNTGSTLVLCNSTWWPEDMQSFAEEMGEKLGLMILSHDGSMGLIYLPT